MLLLTSRRGCPATPHNTTEQVHFKIRKGRKGLLKEFLAFLITPSVASSLSYSHEPRLLGFSGRDLRTCISLATSLLRLLGL